MLSYQKMQYVIFIKFILFASLVFYTDPVISLSLILTFSLLAFLLSITYNCFVLCAFISNSQRNLEKA